MARDRLMLVDRLRGWAMWARGPSLVSTLLRLAVFLLAVDALVVAAVLFVPAARHDFLEEDQFLENVSVLTFVLAACATLAAVTLARRAGAGRWYYLIPAFAAVCALEEISYGERALGLTMPEVAGVKLDALHDAVPLTYEVMKQAGWTKPQMAGLLGCLIAAAAAFLAWERGIVVRAATLAHRHPAFLLVGLSVLWGLSGAVLDLRTYMLSFRFLEEMCEFNAAATLLFSAAVVLAVRDKVAIPAGCQKAEPGNGQLGAIAPRGIPPEI
jgi:hypothetical protein